MDVSGTVRLRTLPHDYNARYRPDLFVGVERKGWTAGVSLRPRRPSCGAVSPRREGTMNHSCLGPCSRIVTCKPKKAHQSYERTAPPP